MQGLKYVSWADNTGYAVAAKSYLRALLEAGVELTWTPMMPSENGYEVRSSAPGDLGRFVDRPIAYDTVLIHTVPEYYPQWIARERSAGRRVFGYTVWELDLLPAAWPAILNDLDGVIVPSRFNLDVFRRSGVTVPIHVVPHLSQFEYAPPPTDADRASLRHRLREQRLAANPYIIYTIAYWSHRKAPYLAVEAYRTAFDANDPVLMVVKTSRNDITRWRRHWRSLFRRRHPSPELWVSEHARRLTSAAPVVVLAEEQLSDGEIRALHEIGDCYISLARAEGWGLGAFEAARAGKPVVATGWGGHLDFLDPSLTSLVDYDMVPVDEPRWASSYSPAERWAQPSVQGAARQLRDIFSNQKWALERSRRQAESIRARFSGPAISEAFLQALA